MWSRRTDRSAIDKGEQVLYLQEFKCKTDRGQRAEFEERAKTLEEKQYEDIMVGFLPSPPIGTFQPLPPSPLHLCLLLLSSRRSANPKSNPRLMLLAVVVKVVVCGSGVGFPYIHYSDHLSSSMVLIERLEFYQHKKTQKKCQQEIFLF